MRFFTADLHFGHKNVIPYCSRPFADRDAMTAGLIERWNQRVSKDDTTYILGDLSFYGTGRTRDILAQLNGEKVLIRGNHDDVKTDEKAKALGMLSVSDSMTCAIGDEIFNMCHYPYEGDSTEVERFLERRIKDDGRWLLHGHVHREWQVRGRQINVGVDVWEWAPLSEMDILSIIQR